MKGVGLSSAVKIVGAVLRVGERPIGLRAPAVNAHYKERDRRLLFNTVVHFPQPTIEPAELEASQVKRVEASGCAELPLRETAGEVRVAPGADDQALVPAAVWRPSKPCKPLGLPERAPPETTVP